MKPVVAGLVWVSVAAALVGFFLPWASIDVRRPDALKRLSQTAQGQAVTRRVGEAAGSLFGKMKQGVKSVGDKLPMDKLQLEKLRMSGVPTSVSGFQVPQLANQKNAQVAMALIEFFVGKQQHVGLKSYAVYLLPGLALLCGLLLASLGGRRPVLIGVALVCAALSGGGFFKLLTTNTQALFIAITIGPGIWLSLWAYAGLAVAGLGLAFSGETGRVP